MICYLILHYKNANATIECINSLNNVSKKSERIIVIIDNASNNGSYETLQLKYHGNPEIDMIKTEENLGYARGNNFGYQYIKSKYMPELIVVCNNDLIFEHSEFEQNLFDEYKNVGFDVAGPDIINMDDIHQNPHRIKMLTYKEISLSILKKRIMLLGLILKQKVFLLNGINILEMQYEKEGLEKRQNIIKVQKIDDIVLQGSCIILGEKFIKEQTIVFCEETFLYYEEDLFAIKCKMNGYIVKYLDNVYVRHMESISTKDSSLSGLENEIFVFRELLKSAKIYREHVKEYEEING